MERAMSFSSTNNHAVDVAKILFSRGYRVVDILVIDGANVAVVTGPRGRVCDVVVMDPSEDGKYKYGSAFCRDSVFDNWTWRACQPDPETPDLYPPRCVENAVFMVLKYMLAQSGVQTLSEDTEDTRKLLVDTCELIPKAVLNCLSKWPELDKDDDPLVALCKAWPTEPLDASQDLETLKKQWIDRNRKVMDCYKTDPKLAKLGVGRALSLKLMGDRFFDDALLLPWAGIAYTTVSHLMCDEATAVVFLGVDKTEEISAKDAKYARLEVGMPEGLGVLDYCLPEHRCLKRMSCLVAHMRKDAPAKELGKINAISRKMATDIFLGKDIEPLSGHDVLVNIGWDRWFDEGPGRGLVDGHSVLMPSVVFKDTKKVTSLLNGEFDLANVLWELSIMVDV